MHSLSQQPLCYFYELGIMERTSWSVLSFDQCVWCLQEWDLTIKLAMEIVCVVLGALQDTSDHQLVERYTTSNTELFAWQPIVLDVSKMP